MSYIHMLPLPKNTLKHPWTWKSRHYFTVHSGPPTTRHFHFCRELVLFWCLQAPERIVIKVWCKKGETLRALWLFSVQRKPGTIWVCMSPFLTAICIITSKSSFSKFLSFPVLCQWWDLVCTMENMLILSCAALVPLPSSPWQMCWGISMCLLGGMLELSVTAGAHSCTASL